MDKFRRVRHVLSISAAFALALLVLPSDLARADAVDDVLASQFQWREAHPLSKARMRVIAGGGAPVGWYYLDLRSSGPTEVAIISLLLGRAELVIRSVTDGAGARIFLNEDVYLALDPASLSLLGGGAFWAARDVAAARAALSRLHDIQGTATRTVGEVTETGIRMLLSQGRWQAFRAAVGPGLMTNLVQDVPPGLTIYFGPSGELRSVLMEGPEANVEVLFHDWRDLAGSGPAAGLGALELEDVRRVPHPKQQRWDMPLDEALIRYIAKLTQ